MKFRGYTYWKITNEYRKRLLIDKNILFSNDKNIIGVWENFNIKPRKLFGLINLSGQQTNTFIYEKN